MREELGREETSHKETKHRVSLLEKEAKSSSLMSLELEDYQRSIRSLEGELAGRSQALDQLQRESHVHQETLQQARKDAGEEEIIIWVTFCLSDFFPMYIHAK